MLPVILGDVPAKRLIDVAERRARLGVGQRLAASARADPRLFDRSGNIGPTVWSDGRLVGGWAQRKNGAVVYQLLEDVGREVARRVEAAAAELSVWLGDTCVTPRFRTPLERELSA